MESFPYTQSYNKIPKLLSAIQNAAVPTKFTISVLEQTFDLKSINDRPLIGILKCLGFIDTNGTPTQKYSDYKNPSNAENILGDSIKSCYDALYQKNEHAHTLSEGEIKGMFTSITGKDSSSKPLNQMVKTFLKLKEIAKFDSISQETEELLMPTNEIPIGSNKNSKDFVLTHTIVLNLPATTDQKVYDTLFRSIKENLL